MTKIWVIYKTPTDYPSNPFVMREHNIYRREGKRVGEPTEKMRIGATLAEVRRSIPAGKQRVERRDDDEPQIVEWWF